MKKILFVVNWYTPQDSESFTNGVFHYEQCIALQQYCDVRLYWPLDKDAGKLVHGVEKGLFTYRSGGNLNKKAEWFKTTMQYLDDICEEYKPDLIHANVGYPAGFVCAIIAKKKHIPFIVTEHAPIEQMGLNRVSRRLIRAFTYSNSSANICVSRDSMERLGKIYPKCKFILNYNGVIDPTTVAIKKEGIRRPEEINCAIVAAFYDKDIKGYQYLIPAIKAVNEMGHRVTLHICGGGKYLDYYKEFAKSIGIAEKCIFYGQCNRQRVYSIISEMDYCISSSIFECSGVSVQEEMLLGKPILVTKSGGANSLTTENTAIVVDKGSVQALIDGIIRMNREIGLFNSKSITEYAKANFEMTTVTKKYLEIYDDVIRG